MALSVSHTVCCILFVSQRNTNSLLIKKSDQPQICFKNVFCVKCFSRDSVIVELFVLLLQINHFFLFYPRLIKTAFPPLKAARLPTFKHFSVKHDKNEAIREIFRQRLLISALEENCFQFERSSRTKCFCCGSAIKAASPLLGLMNIIGAGRISDSANRNGRDSALTAAYRPAGSPLWLVLGKENFGAAGGKVDIVSLSVHLCPNIESLLERLLHPFV